MREGGEFPAVDVMRGGHESMDGGQRSDMTFHVAFEAGAVIGGIVLETLSVRTEIMAAQAQEDGPRQHRAREYEGHDGQKIHQPKPTRLTDVRHFRPCRRIPYNMGEIE